jgi:hypothetical protein
LGIQVVRSSALVIVSVARALFGDPLMADASEVTPVTTPEPCRREQETRDCDGRSQDDPRAIHERRPGNKVIGPV